MELDKTKKWLDDLGYKSTQSLQKVLGGERYYFYNTQNDELVWKMAGRVVCFIFSTNKSIYNIEVN